MKCCICKRKTNWDESYGRHTFIVCPYCYSILRKNNKYALDTILKIGMIKEDLENKKRVDK
jgi:hypothetical protein